MSNYKTIAIIAVCAGMLCYCKPASKSFSYTSNADKDFFAQTMELAGYRDIKADSIKVFRAELIENLVERDEVPEYKLLNTKSDEKPARLADMKNKNYLYLFQLFPSSGDDTLFVYMATTFSAADICTGLGPVYLGVQRRDRIRFESVLNIAELKMKDQPQSLKDKDANPEKFRRYHINEKKGMTTLIFYNDQRIPRPADRSTPIVITQIIRNEENKIGGKKAVIFTTEKVFRDPKALVFTYNTTIHTK